MFPMPSGGAKPCSDVAVEWCDDGMLGVVAQNDGIAQEFVCLNAAPESAFGGALDRIDRDPRRDLTPAAPL